MLTKNIFKHLTFTRKVVFLFSILIISSTIFIPFTQLFLPKIPEAVTYFKMWLTGDAVLNIHVAQDRLEIWSLNSFCGFTSQLSFLALLTGSAVVFFVSTALLIRTILRYKLKNQKQNNPFLLTNL